MTKKCALPVVRSELLEAPNALTWTTADLVADLVRRVTDRVLVTIGTSTAYSLTSGLTLSALATGIRLLVRFHSANGTSPTLLVDGLTAKALRTAEDTTPDPAQIAASRIGEVVYDASANGGAGAWLDYYVNGRNPYDSFRGRELLTDDQFRVGGSTAFQELMKQTWNSAGGGIIHRFQNIPLGEPEPGRLEKFLQAPVVSNSLGRWIKVSNRGVFDRDRRAAEQVLDNDALIREAVRMRVDKNLANPPETFTEAEKVLHRDPKARRYFDELRTKVKASRRSLQEQRERNPPVDRQIRSQKLYPIELPVRGRRRGRGGSERGVNNPDHFDPRARRDRQRWSGGMSTGWFGGGSAGAV